jgi:hypothetical protein
MRNPGVEASERLDAVGGAGDQLAAPLPDDRVATGRQIEGDWAGMA